MSETVTVPTGPDWRVGVSVPWTVSWTGEQQFDLAPSLDFPGLTDLVQVQRPGAGSPVFAVQHVTRHRMGMVAQLCHVCGKPTPKRDRYIFPIQSGGFVTLADGASQFGGNVPPVHLACARRAQRLCPHLRSAYTQPVAYPSEDSRLIQRTDVVPGMEAIARRLPPGLDVVLTCYRLYGPRFSDKVRKLRDAFPQVHAP